MLQNWRPLLRKVVSRHMEYCFFCENTESSMVESSTVKNVMKEGPRQATLFGMMSKAAPRPKKVEIPEPESQDETQETQIESQTTDVSMIDIDTLGDIETQEDSQQRSYSPDWDESLLIDDSTV